MVGFLKFLIPAFCISVFALPSFSQNLSPESTQKQAKQILKLTWENDVFLLSDREYTNGSRLEYGIYSKLYTPSSLMLLGLEKILPQFDKKQEEYSGISLTHSIYTPLNLYSSDASYGERPYSANAMASSISSYFFSKSSFSIETAIGVMGPAAQGKYFQAGIHNIIQAPLPQGWDRQLPNRNLFQINFDHKYFWNPYFGIQTNTNLGNLDTSVTIGPVFRLGRISTPISHGMNISDPTAFYPTEETEYYFYVRPSLKNQSTNLTLGGGGKNHFRAVASQNGSPSVYFDEGRTVFIGEPLYNSVIDERSNNTITRFALYETLVPQDTPFAVNFLMFNTIFNGAPVPNDGLKIALLRSLLDPTSKLTNYPGIEYFIYDTLFRDPTKGVSTYSKILAYNYLTTNGKDLQENLILAALLYYNDANSNTNYNVPLRRIQGKLSTGFFYQAPGWFFQFGVEIASLEYFGGSGLLPFHRYTTVQLGIKF